jgi:hypothetical protein
MASVKKYNGNLVIQTPFKTSAASNITLDTDHLFVTGNLTVRGNITAISSNTQVITDNIITLNAGETGNGVSTLGTTSGIEIARGSAPGGNVRLIWNEPVKSWQVSGEVAGSPGDGTLFTNIAVSSTGGIVVFDDKAPVLGGNLNTNGFTFNANTNSIFSANVQFNNVLAAPLVVTNATILSAQSVSAGQAGLYVTNQASANEELVTKRRAFGFSLFLG